MKVACPKVLLVISVAFLSAGPTIAQSQPNPSPSPSPIALPSNPQDSIKVVVRDEADRLKTDIKEVLQLQMKDEVNRKVNESLQENLGKASLFFAVLTAIFGGAAGRILAGRWKRQFQKEYLEHVKAEVEKQLEQGVTSEFDRKKEEFYRTVADLERAKEDALRELSKILPPLGSNTFEDSQTTFELKQKIQPFTRQLASFNSIPQLVNVLFSAKDYMQQGQAFYFDCNYEKALESYKKALHLDKGNDEALFGMGKALMRLGQYNDSIEVYCEIGEGHPKHTASLVEQACNFRRLKDLDEAIRLCDEAIRINPKYARAWYNKACYLALRSDAAEAVECLREAIKLTPDGKYKRMALTDPDFDSIRDSQPFIELLIKLLRNNDITEQ